MRITKAVKTEMGIFLALWFSGQLSDLAALATALERIAAIARKEDEIFNQVDRAAKNAVS